MKTSLLCALAATTLLGACGKLADKAVPAASAPVAAATEATLPADAARAAPSWTATPEGVGPLSAATPFTREAVAALFPDAEVRTAYLNDGGTQSPIITVNRPAGLVLEIQDGPLKGRVGTILAQGGPVIGPRGEALLTPWAGLGFKASDCAIGGERFSGAALCWRPGSPALAYVFGAPGEMPGAPGAAADETLLTRKGFLREFLWQTPRPR